MRALQVWGLAALIVVSACNGKKKSSGSQPPAAQGEATQEVTTAPSPAPVATQTETVAPSVGTGVTGGSSGSASTVSSSELSAPSGWDASASSVVGTTATATDLDASLRGAVAMAASFDILPQAVSSLSAVEAKVEECARGYLEKLTFQVSQNQFVVQAPPATEGVEACVKAANLQSQSGYSYSFSHGLGIQCANASFDAFQGKPLTAAKDGLCLQATRGEIVYNVTLTVTEGTRKYKHVRALQGVQGEKCVFTSEGGVRTWQDCQWVDKAERDGKGLRYTGIKYSASKADIGGDRLYFSGGSLDVTVDQWQGRLDLSAGKAAWSMTSSQGQTQAGQSQIQQNPNPVPVFTPAQSSTGTGTTTGGSVVSQTSPGVSALGTAAAISCGMGLKELTASGTAHLQSGDVQFFAGYHQVSSTNKNPVVVRFDGAALTWCREDYETTGDDGAAYGLLWNGADVLYGVFSSTGTQGDPSQDYRRFVTGGWLTSYGNGGGPKVAVVLRMAASSGIPSAGTFLRAQTGDGKTNSLEVTGLSLTSSGLRVSANSWYSPLNVSKQPFTCQGGSPFAYTLNFDANLQTAQSAQAANCQ